jgi:hypothetical protein
VGLVVSFSLLQSPWVVGAICARSDGDREWLGHGSAARCRRSVGVDRLAVVAEEVFVDVRGVGWRGGAHALLDGWPQVRLLLLLLPPLASFIFHNGRFHDYHMCSRCRLPWLLM